MLKTALEGYVLSAKLCRQSNWWKQVQPMPLSQDVVPQTCKLHDVQVYVQVYGLSKYTHHSQAGIQSKTLPLK